MKTQEVVRDTQIETPGLVEIESLLELPVAKYICPHLGLQEDPDTRFGYPCIANYCYLAQPAQPISKVYQELTCLSEEHRYCRGPENIQERHARQSILGRVKEFFARLGT